MQKKLYTEDDLRELFGLAIDVMRRGLTTGTLSERCTIAVDFLRLPLSSVLFRGQQEAETFPEEIEKP